MKIIEKQNSKARMPFGHLAFGSVFSWGNRVTWYLKVDEYRCLALNNYELYDFYVDLHHLVRYDTFVYDENPEIHINFQ